MADVSHISLEAVAVALALGSLHALEPGHGKTALLVYMADGRKSYWHSVVVGVSSFFSHTFSILLISFVVHAATHFAGEMLDARSITLYTGLCSGTILLGLGVYLMTRTYRNGTDKSDCCGHDHHAGSGKVPGQAGEKGKKAKFSLSAVLGVSVGLYPCPTAIAAYLNAVADGNINSGYYAIVTYGLGIGVTIMVVGIVSGILGRSAFSLLRKNISQVLVSRVQSVIFMLVGITQLVHVSF